MSYVVYLDEFGHIGPYVGHDDPNYNTHPLFGLAGMALPANRVRNFSSFFFELKKNLLSFEIQRAQCHPAVWEKKGSSLYTLKNVQKYQELRTATFRIFNKIKACDGFVFYVGVEKDRTPDRSNAKGLYKRVLNEALKRLDQEFTQRQSSFMILCDQQDDMQNVAGKGMRADIVRSASTAMFGHAGVKSLIEVPVQAESHLYQTLQCADWICGLVGRLQRYHMEPKFQPDMVAFETYFGDRLKAVATRSSIRPKSFLAHAAHAGDETPEGGEPVVS